jgi:hypothetical protein
MTIQIPRQASYPIAHVGGIIRPMSDVVHIYGSSYEKCPVCGQKCAYGGDTNAAANEPVIRPADWEIELHCSEHGFFRVLAGNLIQPDEFFK